MAPAPVRDAILLSNGNIVSSINDNIFVMSQDNKILGTTPMTSPNRISIRKKNKIYVCADKIMYCSEIADDKQLMYSVCVKNNVFWVIKLYKTTNAYQLNEYNIDDK